MTFIRVKHKINGHTIGDLVGDGVDEHGRVNLVVADATIAAYSFAGKLAL